MAELLVTDRQGSTALRPLSPAHHLAGTFAAAEVTGPRGVALREVAFLAMTGLRLDPASAGARRVQAHLGLALPTRCGEVSGSGDTSVLWLSPDEFLVVAADRDPAELTVGLAEALGEDPGSVVDLSANRTTFELSGPSAVEVLSKGCPLDLHPRAFAVGQAYVTSLGSVPVLLTRTGDAVFRVQPRASFADHVGRWLVDAMAEFAAPEVI